MKKLLSVIICLALIIAALPLSTLNVSAATSGKTGNCTWSLDGTVLTISGNGAMADYSYNSSFLPWGRSITQVIIQNGVTSIGSFAFYYCSSLKAITIPDSATSIGSHAFSGCSKLTSITIPDSVTSIGEYAFNDCDSLTSVKLSNSVTSIAEGVFDGCKSLKTITIPDSVTSIGYIAFNNCDSLKKVFYRGSRSDKAKIAIGSDNTPLTNATWYYNSCIGAAEHTYDNTCDTICNGCDYVRTASHSYEWIIDKTETCGEKGIKHEECTVCHVKRNVDTIIKATGIHVYEGTKDAFCNICGYKRVITCDTCNGHRTVKESSKCTNCSGMGITSKNCITCDGSGISDYDNAYRRCAECNGYGLIYHSSETWCEFCSGKGEYKLCTICGREVPYNQSRCSYCAPYDYVVVRDCYSCENGWIYYYWQERCTKCDDGYIWVSTPITCDACNGKGNYSVDCFQCVMGNIVQDVPCKDCDGTGNISSSVDIPCSHTYDNSCDKNCNKCQQERTPSHVYVNNNDLICNICGYERPPYIIGDCNGDYKIDTTDLAELKLYLAGLQASVGKGSDLNGDGKIDTTDLAILKLKLAGIE